MSMPDFKFDHCYSTKCLQQNAARFSENGEAFIHQDCDNLDGGVLITFRRWKSRWRMQGIGRMRYAFEPGRTLFADKMPDYPECEIESRDGKYYVVVKATREVMREFVYPKGGAA